MNRQPIWIIAPFVLLLTSLAWWAHAQSVGETPETSPTSRSTPAATDDIVVTATSDGGIEVSGPDQASNALYQLLQSHSTPLKIERIKLGSKPSQQKERKLERQTRALVEEYRADSDTGKRAVARDNLTAVVNEHFALRQAERQRELDELAKELDRLTALHERRQNQQDKIVADRVESLLREADGLGWGSSSSSRGVARGILTTPPQNTPAINGESRPKFR